MAQPTDKYKTSGAGYKSFSPVNEKPITDETSYVELEVATNVNAYDDQGIHIGLAGAITSKHEEVLDNTTNNVNVGLDKPIKHQTVVVPNIDVPQSVKDLTKELTYENGVLVTPKDEKVADEVSKLADTIAQLADYNTPNYISQDSLDPTLNTLVAPLALDGYTGLDTSMTIPLTTQQSSPCRPETKVVVPEFDRTKLEESKEMQDMLKRLEDLLGVDTEPKEKVEPVDKSLITTRETHGHGIFDWLSTATLNQIEYGINEKRLFTKDDAKAIYSEALGQMMQHGVQFALSKEQATWQSYLIKAQMMQANVQALLAKAELIMMPTKVRLAYAQLQAQLRQLDLLEYQIEQEKHRIPQIVAQTDQIREQTSLICQQRKLAVEQLAQAELDRKLKQEQVTQAQIQSQVIAEQLTQSKQQTKQLVAQTEQTVEQTKLINAQAQGALKDIKLKDAQLIQMRATLKLQAQQLLKEKEQAALIKAQTATAYANITALTEQLKAAKAQYSDTIDGKPIGGVLGAQINVNKAQAVGFERDGYNKFYSALQSGWSTKKTADLATLSPSAFNALGLDRATNWYAQKYFNMPNDVFEMPKNYRDYLSDDEMNGTENTPNPSNAKVLTK